MNNLKGIGLLVLPIHLILAFQNISGVILDHNSSPIKYTTILHVTDGSWTTADENGFFLLHSKFSEGDTLEISRIGYFKEHYIVDKSANVQIILTKKIIGMTPVSVAGKLSQFDGELAKGKFTGMDSYSRHSSLQRIPGSLIKSYGGMAGITNVSMDGGQPIHTKIVLNGIDLTNPQNGQTDLSDIPNELMQQLYLGRSPNLYFGSGSFDGVVHIRPMINRSFLKLGAGSFGYQSGSAGYNWTLPRTKVHVQYGKNMSSGDYPITQGDSTITRRNNNFSQNFFLGQLHFQTNHQQLLKGLVFSSNQDRGVAGNLSWPSPKAHRENKINLIGLQYVYLTRRGHVRLHSYQRFSDEHYQDPDLGINSYHQVNVSGVTINGQQNFNDYLELNGIIDLKRESIESTDMGNQIRTTMASGIQAAVRFISWLQIQPGYRIDMLGDFQGKTYDLTSSMNSSILGKLTLSLGTGFHAPTFNDLYWPADSYSEGNPDLKIERNQYQIIRWENNFRSKTNFSIEYRKRHSHNLITWSADENYIWKPQNIDESERKNMIMSVSIPTRFAGLSISGHVTHTKAIDMNTRKTLQYVPESSANILIDYTRENFALEFQGQYTGKRTYQGYNKIWEPVDLTLNRFIDVNIGLHCIFPLGAQQLTVHFIIQNVLDQNTAFFPDYPEPGRRIKLGIELGF